MGNDHTHEPVADHDLGPAFKWAIILNVSYVLTEAGAGFAIGSLSLLADAAHNLTDVAGLLIAWGAVIAARKPPSDRFSYGFGRSTILAALANSIAILVGVGAVVLESTRRFSDPVVVPAMPVIIVAAIGIAVNAGTAMLFSTDRHHDLNAEGAFLHMAADAAVSAGVVISAVAMLATGWSWLDPFAAILVSVVIAWTAFGLLKSSIGLSLDAVPDSVDRREVAEWLQARPGIDAVHDLHIWSLSTTAIALTAHLVMPKGHPGDAFLVQLAHDLNNSFGIAHATFQVEIGDASECRLAPANVV